MPAQRKCRGREGKNCNKFMSNLEVDGHLLCTSCRGQTCTREQTCSECEKWSETQWENFLNRKNTYQDRKEKKIPSSSSESGSSVSMPNLSLQVTPKPKTKKNSKASISSKSSIGNSPQSSSSKISIIPDTPRTNALREEFSSQIAVLREENQRNIQQLIELTSRVIPPSSPAVSKATSAKGTSLFRVPPSVQSVALSTTDGPGVSEKPINQSQDDLPAVNRQPAGPSEFDDSDFIAIHVEEDVLSSIHSERELSPAPKKRKVSSQESRQPSSPIRPPVKDLPRIPKKKDQSDSPRPSARQDRSTEDKHLDKHSAHSREYRSSYRSSSDRSRSPNRRNSPSYGYRRNYDDYNRHFSPERSYSSYRKSDRRERTDSPIRSPSRGYRGHRLNTDYKRQDSPSRYRSPSRSYSQRQYDRDNRNVRHSSPAASYHSSRRRYKDDQYNTVNNDTKRSEKQGTETVFVENLGIDFQDSAMDADAAMEQDQVVDKEIVNRLEYGLDRQFRAGAEMTEQIFVEEKESEEIQQQDIEVNNNIQVDRNADPNMGITENNLQHLDTRVVHFDTPAEETINDFVSSSEAQDTSYLDVLGWIQEQFPETIEKIPPCKSSGSLIESLFGQTKTSTSLPALPWSKGCIDSALDTDSIMSGSSKNRKANLGPLRMGKSIPAPEFNYRYYKVQSIDNLQPASINRSIEDIVPSRERENLKKNKPDLSVEDIKTMEVSARKTRVLSSALDWQIASAVKILQSVCDSSPTPGLSKALRLLLSAGKTTSQLQKEATNSLGNILLKRREPILNKLPRQIPDQDKLDLRASSVNSTALFDETVVRTTTENLQTAITRDAQLRIVQSNRPTQEKPAVKNYKNMVKGKANVQPKNNQSGSNFSRLPQGGAAGPGEQQQNSQRKVTFNNNNRQRNNRGRRN